MIKCTFVNTKLKLWLSPYCQTECYCFFLTVVDLLEKESLSVLAWLICFPFHLFLSQLARHSIISLLAPGPCPGLKSSLSQAAARPALRVPVVSEGVKGWSLDVVSNPSTPMSNNYELFETNRYLWPCHSCAPVLSIQPRDDFGHSSGCTLLCT